MVQILLGITTNLICHSRTDLDLTISLAKTDPKYARGHLFSHMAQLLPRKGLKLCRTKKTKELISGWDIKNSPKRDFNIPLQMHDPNSASC